MLEIVGLDVGYSFTKTSTGIMFPSQITDAEPMLGHGCTLKLGNTTYFIGIGNGTVSLNKIDDEITSVLALYALCGSLQGTKCKVVTGLPVGQYVEQREQLKALLVDKLHSTKVVYNGEERTIIIEDAAVYPQGLLPIEDDYISVDIGGITCDIIYVRDGDVAFRKTLFKGMRSLHSKIIDVVNSKYGCKYENDYAHKILTDGFYVLRVKQDISFLHPVYKEHVESIVTEIKEFTPNNVKVYVTGGGGLILYKAIKNRIPSAELYPDSQFSNAEVFKMWGELRWQKSNG